MINERIAIMKNRVENNFTKSKDDRSWTAIPFVGKITYRIAKVLRDHLSLNLGYYTGTKLSSFLNSHKDRSDIENLKCGIYSVKCLACEKKYIEETKRDYETRYCEHISHCRYNRTQQSAIALHLAENPGHFPDKMSLTLIEKEHRTGFRKNKESLYIRKCPNTMNTSVGWKFNGIWASTLIPLLKDV
jgi:hypothetical protein